MSSSNGQYQRLLPRNEEDVEEDNSPTKAFGAQPYQDEDDGILLDPSSSKYPSGPPPSYSQSRGWFGYRLSKSCVAICVLVLAIFISLIGGGGYYLYQIDLINGQSPPWYPSPRGGTVSSWQDSYAKAKKKVGKMSLVEKVNITTGIGWAEGLCVGSKVTTWKVSRYLF
jgi:hypothetical protein